jgi:hypothetical protein
MTGARVITLAYRLLVTMLSWLVLLARSSASKDMEILTLRHDIAVPHQTNRKTTPGPDRSSNPGGAIPDPAQDPAGAQDHHAGHTAAQPSPTAHQHMAPPRPPGRPPIGENIAALIVRVATDNQT